MSLKRTADDICDLLVWDQFSSIKSSFKNHVIPSNTIWCWKLFANVKWRCSWHIDFSLDYMRHNWQQCKRSFEVFCLSSRSCPQRLSRKSNWQGKGCENKVFLKYNVDMRVLPPWHFWGISRKKLVKRTVCVFTKFISIVHEILLLSWLNSRKLYRLERGCNFETFWVRFNLS